MVLIPDIGAISAAHQGGASSIAINPAGLATRKIPDQDRAHTHRRADALRNASEGISRTGTGAGTAESLDVHCFHKSCLHGDDHQCSHHKQELEALEAVRNLSHV